MTAQHQVVRYEPRFKAEVLALQQYLWSPDVELNASYFHWKYEQNPYEKRPLIYLTLQGNEVVGMLGMHASQWEGGDSAEKVHCVCGGDLIFAPRHRGRHLVPRMMTFALDDLAALGYSFVLTLSAGKVTYLQCLRTGCRNAGYFDALHREPQYASQKGCMMEALPEDASRPFTRFDRNATELHPRSIRHVSVAQAPNPVAMAQLVERIGTDGRLRHVRDQRYFEWRFRNPLCIYRFLFWQDAMIDGYLVLQAPAMKPAKAFQIVDWEAANDAIRADLLHAAVQWAGAEGLSTWSASLSSGTKALLRHSGFQPESSPGPASGFRPGLLVRSTPDKNPGPEWRLSGVRLLAPENWDLRMIYSDRY